MNTTGLRIIIDTNVFITILAKNGEHRWLMDGIIAGDFVLCISNEILMEYWEVLENKTTPEIAANVINFLVVHPHIYFFSPYIQWHLVYANADDNKFIDCYLCSNAAYLITNDKHFNFLTHLSFPKVTIATTKEFKQLLH